MHTAFHLADDQVEQPVDLSLELRVWQRAAFWVIAVISLTNLNGVAKLIWGREGAFSVVLLVAALAAFVPPVASLWMGMGTVGGFFVLFLSLFLGIGVAVAQLSGGRADTADLVRQSIISLLVIVPCAQYAFVAARTGRIRFLFRMLATICTVHVIAVLTFGWWGSDVYTPVVSNIDFDVTRHSGLFWNPNEAGLALVVITMLYMTLAHMSRRAWIPRLLAVSAAVAIMLTFSRGAMLLLLIVMIYTTLRSTMRRRNELIAGLAVLAVVLGVLFAMPQPDYIDDAQWARVTDVRRLLQADGTAADRADNDRAELLKRGIGEWMSSPVVGNGLGSQRVLRGEYIGVHNTIVMVLGESGLLPGIVFIAFLGVFLRRSLKLQQPVIRDFLFAFGIVVIGICVQSHNFLETRFYNAFLGIALGLLAGSTPRVPEILAASRPLWRESSGRRQSPGTVPGDVAPVAD